MMYSLFGYKKMSWYDSTLVKGHSIVFIVMIKKNNSLKKYSLRLLHSNNRFNQDLLPEIT